MTMKKLSKELIKYILINNPDINAINNMKISLAAKYGIKKIPLNSEILPFVNKKDIKKISKALVVKDTRTLSGVNVIAVMNKPSKCPHGKCIYCPGGIEQNVPQSYTGFEPATMRAIANGFDPSKQVINRIQQLENVGHDVSKIELIIMGGTFNAQPLIYQKKFVKDIYDALSNKQSKTLEQAKSNVETSYYRPIGLTIETRPDICSKKDVENLLNLGTTRVELGVQSISDAIYKKTNRGHSLKDVQEATQLLKDSGLKVLYHIMPGLFSTPKKDNLMFGKLFTDEAYKPDMLKIYPALVMPNTILFDMWKNGKFDPYDDEKLFDFLKEFYPKVPYWNRIMRIQRDIPINRVSQGPRKSNVREIILDYCEKNKIKLKEIRARQLGFVKSKSEINDYKIFVEKYRASKGTEYFISYESSNRDQIVGFVRLRFPYKPFLAYLKNAALVRELHVYGKIVRVNEKSNSLEQGQHQGIGKLLLKEAEKIAKKNNYKKISVISGLGVREYYYKLGYYKDHYHVSKNI